MLTQAVDALTPLGRGQAQLVTGPHGAGKSRCGIDTVLGQVRPGSAWACMIRELRALSAQLVASHRCLSVCSQPQVSGDCCIQSGYAACEPFMVLLCQAGAGVQCVLALVGHDAERLAAVEAELARYGAMRYTTTVSAPAGAQTLAQPSGLC